MTKYLRGGLLLLWGWLLSCEMGWAQNQAVYLNDVSFVLGPGNNRSYLRETMQAFYDQHHLRLALTLVTETSSYQTAARHAESSFLAQSSPGLAITTFHEYPAKDYRRHQVQVNEALAQRLPLATAQHVVEQWLNYYHDALPPDAMQQGFSLVLHKLGEYLQALPPAESVPTITFARSRAPGASPLGLDAFSYPALASEYEEQTIHQEDYPVAWKALPSGQPESVLAQVDEGVSFPPGVAFKQNGHAIPWQPTSQNHRQQLTLTGQAHQQEGSVEVYASSEEEAELVGKLNTISYDVLPKKLVLIGLDDAILENYLVDAGQAVQAIYAQAGVQLSVETQLFSTAWGNREVALADQTSGLLSNYPPELKRVIKDYSKEHEAEKETAYVFVAGKSSTGKRGYMPKKRPYGFVYVDAHAYQPLAPTIAHELGHGWYSLRLPGAGTARPAHPGLPPGRRRKWRPGGE